MKSASDGCEFWLAPSHPYYITKIRYYTSFLEQFKDGAIRRRWDDRLSDHVVSTSSVTRGDAIFRTNHNHSVTIFDFANDLGLSLGNLLTDLNITTVWNDNKTANESSYFNRNEEYCNTLFHTYTKQLISSLQRFLCTTWIGETNINHLTWVILRSADSSSSRWHTIRNWQSKLSELITEVSFPSRCAVLFTTRPNSGILPGNLPGAVAPGTVPVVGPEPRVLPRGLADISCPWRTPSLLTLTSVDHSWRRRVIW